MEPQPPSSLWPGLGPFEVADATETGVCVDVAAGAEIGVSWATGWRRSSDGKRGDDSESESAAD